MFPYFSKHSLRGYFVTSIAVLNLKDVNINTEAFFFFFCQELGQNAQHVLFFIRMGSYWLADGTMGIWIQSWRFCSWRVCFPWKQKDVVLPTELWIWIRSLTHWALYVWIPLSVRNCIEKLIRPLHWEKLQNCILMYKWFVVFWGFVLSTIIIISVIITSR